MIVTRDEQHEHAAVAVCSTVAAADLVATTLAVHGIAATTSASTDPIPSLGWVQGFHVTVPVGEEARAREVLAALSGRTDVAQPDDGSSDPQSRGR